MNSPGGPRSGVIRDVTGRGRVSCAVVGLLRKIDTSFKEERLRCGGSTFFIRWLCLGRLTVTTTSR